MRGDLAQQQSILPVLAPAGHQVQVFLQQAIDHAWNVDRVVLQVAVHGHDHVTACSIEARLHCRGLLEVSHQLDDPHMRSVRCRAAPELGGRGVGAAIVDEQDFPRKG